MEERKRLAARLRWRDELRVEAAEANKAVRRKRKSEEEDADSNRRNGAKKKKKMQRRSVAEEDGGGEKGEGGGGRGWGLLESLDPDTGLCVLSFLDTEDLVRQRAVSRRWGDLASADCLWKPHFLRLYGPPFLNRKEEEEEGAEGSWFGRYAEASRGMPRMPRDQEAPFPGELTDWEVLSELDEDDGSEYEIKDAQFSVVALPHLRPSEVGFHHHCLALHLAFLHTNGHVPRLTDRVRIGARQVKHATITLARFCYAVGNKRQSQLLEQLGLPSPLDNSTFLSPDVGDESDFEPFVSLRIPSPETTFAPGEGIPYSFVDDNPETFGEAEDLGAGYQFISKKREGWAPGFFNASFSWYSYGCFTTLHNTARREIFVIKTREKKAVW